MSCTDNRNSLSLRAEKTYFCHVKGFYIWFKPITQIMRPLQLHEYRRAVRIATSCLTESVSSRHTCFSFLALRWATKQYIRFVQRKAGAFIAEDRKSLALILPVSSDKDQRDQVRWKQAIWMLPLKRWMNAGRFRRNMLRYLPAEPHLNVLLLASNVNQCGISAMVAMRDEIVSLSELMQLPIYARTASKRLRDLYERLGFTTYAQLPIPDSREQVYFVKWVPQSLKTAA